MHGALESTHLSPDNHRGGTSGTITLCYLEEVSAHPRHLGMRSTVPLGQFESVLLCDPLTGLLAYESFAQHLTAELEHWLDLGVHLAIGDVDGLKDYVTSSNSTDPNLFGHLAGNRCMKTVGAVVRRWVVRNEGDWASIVCGTFGGDEVIIAAAGGKADEFIRAITDLSQNLRDQAPRPCSFMCSSIEPGAESPTDRDAFYAKWVGSVDRALFALKAAGTGSGQVRTIGQGFGA